MIPAIIAAGAALLGGLFGAQADAEKERKRLLAEGTNKSFDTKQAAQQNLTEGQQLAFKNLIEGTSNALINKNSTPNMY